MHVFLCLSACVFNTRLTLMGCLRKAVCPRDKWSAGLEEDADRTALEFWRNSQRPGYYALLLWVCVFVIILILTATLLCPNSWRFVFYLSAFIGGMVALHDVSNITISTFFQLKAVMVKWLSLFTHVWTALYKLTFHHSSLFCITCTNIIPFFSAERMALWY